MPRLFTGLLVFFSVSYAHASTQTPVLSVLCDGKTHALKLDKIDYLNGRVRVSGAKIEVQSTAFPVPVKVQDDESRYILLDGADDKLQFTYATGIKDENQKIQWFWSQEQNVELERLGSSVGYIRAEQSIWTSISDSLLGKTIYDKQIPEVRAYKQLFEQKMAAIARAEASYSERVNQFIKNNDCQSVAFAVLPAESIELWCSTFSFKPASMRQTLTRELREAAAWVRGSDNVLNRLKDLTKVDVGVYTACDEFQQAH
jgi:hypothetical protein